MSTSELNEHQLVKLFNDYDQTVDVVSCWQALSESILKADTFHRFPKFQPGDLTPDFAITATRQLRGKNEHAIDGSFICDIKKFPNPYADSPEGDFKGYAKSIEQLKKYGNGLKLPDGSKAELIWRARHSAND